MDLLDVLVQVARISITLSAARAEKRLQACMLTFMYLETVLRASCVSTLITLVLRIALMNTAFVDLQLTTATVNLLTDFASQSFNAMHFHVMLLKSCLVLAVGVARKAWKPVFLSNVLTEVLRCEALLAALMTTPKLVGVTDRLEYVEQVRDRAHGRDSEGVAWHISWLLPFYFDRDGR